MVKKLTSNNPISIDKNNQSMEILIIIGRGGNFSQTRIPINVDYNMASLTSNGVVLACNLSSEELLNDPTK